MMMKALLPLLLSLLLFSGCASQSALPESDTNTLPDIRASSEPAQQVQNPAPRILPLIAGEQWQLDSSVSGMATLNDHLLLFCGSGNTVLHLLDPETMDVIASYDTGIPLPEDPSVQCQDSHICWFDGTAMETVVLDSQLREISRLNAPEDLVGIPLLSSDRQTIYYCTGQALRALDPDTGISRIIKEMAYPAQTVSDLLVQDTVVQLTITDTDGKVRTLFLSTETGSLLAETEGTLSLQTGDGVFFSSGTIDGIDTILFGKNNEAPILLQPMPSPEMQVFFPNDPSLLSSIQEENALRLDLYNPQQGIRYASHSLPGAKSLIQAIQTSDKAIWLLYSTTDGNRGLYRWDRSATPVQDSTPYAFPYYTRGNPDYDGLARCSLQASQIGDDYGMEILIYKDAVHLEPWDYQLEYEYRADVTANALETLEKSLSNFPPEILDSLTETFPGFHICIVRSAEGTPESGSPQAVNGIQFWDGYDSYIVLSTRYDTERTLYHELCHLMETVILTKSTAYDRWDNLNPSDFNYDNAYTTDYRQDPGKWMEPGREYFIDTYSMSYPKEDRARILEFAMMEGQEDRFRSPRIQAKLRQICIGIREGFDLTSADPYLWEQYLTQPLNIP